MKPVFKHGDGRLKTMRITIAVFVLVMAGLAVMYKMGKSVDQIFVKIDHVFEAEKPIPVQKIEQQVKKELARAKQAVEQEMSKQLPQNPRPEKQKTEQKTLPALKPAPEKQMAVKKAIPKAPTLQKAKADAKADLPQKEALKPVFPKKDADPEPLELASDQYVELYRQWQAQGDALENESEEKLKRVGLQILNLKNVYDLFQMKAVVVKEGEPHMDLEDRSRVAESSLAQFSSTCFIVAEPWLKWGKELEDSGFTRTDNIEVRYYTYDFIRNAIYARALKAFDWSLQQAGLPAETDPADADVLGQVFAVNRKGGGAFGVFVPMQVDFTSGRSVRIDAASCFSSEKDVMALSRAGIL